MKNYDIEKIQKQIRRIVDEIIIPAEKEFDFLKGGMPEETVKKNKKLY